MERHKREASAFKDDEEITKAFEGTASPELEMTPEVRSMFKRNIKHVLFGSMVRYASSGYKGWKIVNMTSTLLDEVWNDLLDELIKKKPKFEKKQDEKTIR
jgi:hypothetical protein